MSRRKFALGVVGQAMVPRSTARPNVGEIDRERMVRLGTAALGVTVAPVTATVGKGSPGGVHEYFSSESFGAHRNGLREVCLQVGALAGAYGVTREEKFAVAGVGALRTWFVDPKIRMTPHLRFARVGKDEPLTGTAEGVIEGIWLAEMALGVAFLAASEAMTNADLAGLKAWLAEYLAWLTAEEDSGTADRGAGAGYAESSWVVVAAAGGGTGAGGGE